jgi:hypothetical protein
MARTNAAAPGSLNPCAGDRFVDAPELRRISDRAVALGVAAVDDPRFG